MMVATLIHTSVQVVDVIQSRTIIIQKLSLMREQAPTTNNVEVMANGIGLVVVGMMKGHPREITLDTTTN